MHGPVNVVCMKWGTAYGAHYVNRLHSMVRRHLSRPFRFICFTDDQRGLSPDLECRPLPALDLPGGLDDLRWRKVGVFRALADVSGPVLYLDLDLVVVGSLDPFLDAPGRFLAVRDAELFPSKLSHRFRPQRAARFRITGNSSVLRFMAGSHVELTEEFERDTRRVLDGFRNEQEFISIRLLDRGQMDYWPAGWCVSFKRHCVPSGPRSWFGDPRIPPDARVVLFAGRLKPHHVLDGTGGRWYRRIGPTPWLARHWR